MLVFNPNAKVSIVLEGVIDSNIIYGSDEFNYKNKSRYVMIDNAPNHNGRMKISKHGIKIRKENKKDYICLAVDGGEIKVIEGDPSEIDMSKRELDFYKEVFNRNKTTIVLAGIDGKDIYFENPSSQFINDEKMYAAKENNKFKHIHHFERDSLNGSFTAYDNKNKVLFINDINGKNIVNNNTLAYNEYNKIII